VSFVGWLIVWSDDFWRMKGRKMKFDSEYKENLLDFGRTRYSGIHKRQQINCSVDHLDHWVHPLFKEKVKSEQLTEDENRMILCCFSLAGPSLIN
jgi:hypothetical protein